EDPLAAGLPREEVERHPVESVRGHARRLGGERAEQAQARIRTAISTQDLSAHDAWIEDLLVNYYDKAYRFAFERHERQVLFRGDAHACLEWLAERWRRRAGSGSA